MIRRLAVAVVAASTFVLTSVPGHAGGNGGNDDAPADVLPESFYRPPSRRLPPAHPGKVLRVEEMISADRWLPPGSDARTWRLLYTSTGFDGRPVAVSGIVFTPPGAPPKHGWPVISWAHGTVGIANKCAPSHAGRSLDYLAVVGDYLQLWLDAGYAVVATDYEGLGTPGAHPYLNGLSEAYATADMVRAARRARPLPRLAKDWAVVGHSQGGQAALFTGVIADDYARELDFRGTVSLAPPSHWEVTFGLAPPPDVVNPGLAFLPLIFRGLAVARPEIDAEDYVTPYALQLWPLADELCFSPDLIQAAITLGLTTNNSLTRDLATDPALQAALDAVSEPPLEGYDGPVYLAQGSADTTVPAPTVVALAGELCAAGADLTFTLYAGTSHRGVLATSFADTLAWTERIFAGDAPASNCQP